MPRPGPRRGIVGVRLSDEQREGVERRAVRNDLVKGDGSPNISEQIRLDIDYANSPARWKEIDAQLWQEIDRAPEADKLQVLMDARAAVEQTFRALDAAIKRRGAE